MKTYSCKCGCKEVFIQSEGIHTGLYCADCGKWIKWLSKDEIRPAKRYIENYSKENQNVVI
jgi:hypothetical protein